MRTWERFVFSFESSIIWKVYRLDGFDEIWFNAICVVAIKGGVFIEEVVLCDETFTVVFFSSSGFWSRIFLNLVVCIMPSFNKFPFVFGVITLIFDRH
jgi:hypothetical protein